MTTAFRSTDVFWDNIPFSHQPPTHPTCVLDAYNDVPIRSYTIKDMRACPCSAQWEWDDSVDLYHLALTDQNLHVPFDPFDVRLFRAVLDDVPPDSNHGPDPLGSGQKRAALDIWLGDRSWIAPLPTDALPSLREMSRVEESGVLHVYVKKMDSQEDVEPESLVPLDDEVAAFPSTFGTEGKVLVPFPNRFPFSCQEEAASDAQTSTPERNETVHHPPTTDRSLSSLFSSVMHAHRDVLSTSDLRTCTTWVLQACVDQSLYASSSEIRHIVRLLRCVDPSCAEAYAEELWRA